MSKSFSPRASEYEHVRNIGISQFHRYWSLNSPGLTKVSYIIQNIHSKGFKRTSRSRTCYEGTWVVFSLILLAGWTRTRRQRSAKYVIGFDCWAIRTHTHIRLESMPVCQQKHFRLWNIHHQTKKDLEHSNFENVHRTLRDAFCMCVCVCVWCHIEFKLSSKGSIA